MIKRKRFYKIQARLICFFTMLIISVILFLSIVSYQFTLTNNKRLSTNYISDILSEVSSRIDDYIEGTKNLSTIIANNNDILEVMIAYDNYEVPSETSIQDARNHLNIIASTRPEVENIAIISLNEKILFGDEEKIINTNSKYRIADWFLKPLTLIKEVMVSPPHKQDLILNESKTVISISKCIIDKTSNKVVGVVLIDLNYQKIKEICKNIQKEQDSYIYILDRIGNIIYHPQQDLISDGELNEKIHSILRSDTDIISYPDKEYIKLNSTITDWTSIGVINKDTLVKDKDILLRFYLYLSLISIAIISIVTIIFSKSITKPITELEKTMEKAQVDLNVRSTIKVNNEIGKLGNTFNTMLDKLQLLMVNIKLREEEKRSLEIKSLQAQIKPHFLYNTLETIIWLSADNKNDDVVEVTSALAGLFRSSIVKNDGLVTLKMEKQNIESYLTIQKIRYKNKLNYKIDIPEELLFLKVPSLILQPIIENSLYHGLKPSKNGGDILITAEKNEGSFKIIIKDTGMGMSKEKLESLFVFDQTNDSIGVLNVHNRIKLTFGEMYGLKYQSTEGVGTTATLTFPIKTSSKES